MPELIYDKTPWLLQPEKCPADLHFLEWLRESRLEHQTIFQFGTGMHHSVGVEAARMGHYTLGVTGTPLEAREYISRVIDEPWVARFYHCYFGDIYLSDPRILPFLDIAYLPHMGEFADPRRAEYGGVNDEDLLKIFLTVLKARGHMIFYTGSSAWDRVSPLVSAAFSWLHSETYRSLLIFQK